MLSGLNMMLTCYNAPIQVETYYIGLLNLLATGHVQGAVSPIDAVVSAATGVTMRSQGHGGF